MTKLTIKIPRALISCCDFRDKNKRTTDGIGACDLLYGMMIQAFIWTAVVLFFFGITLILAGIHSALFHDDVLPPSRALMFSALPYTTSLLVAGFAISGLCKYVDFTGR